jgi:hypothetical protein
MHLKGSVQGCAVFANYFSLVLVAGSALDDHIGNGGQGLPTDVIAFFTLSSSRLRIA